MVRASFILSDMAMGRLRQYDELDSQYLKNLLSEPLSPLNRQYIHEIKLDMLKNKALRVLIQSDFLREISLLWMFPGIQIMRSLEWHLALDDELLAWIEKNAILLQSDYLMADSDDKVALDDFFSQVYKAYTMAYNTHAAARLFAERDQS